MIGNILHKHTQTQIHLKNEKTREKKECQSSIHTPHFNMIHKDNA